MSRKFRITLTMEVKDPRAKPSAIRAYVRDAVSCWGGQFEPPDAYDEGSPGDPLFGSHKVTVQSVEPVT